MTPPPWLALRSINSEDLGLQVVLMALEILAIAALPCNFQPPDLSAENCLDTDLINKLNPNTDMFIRIIPTVQDYSTHPPSSIVS
jgi:hypothetical protein